MTNCPVPNPKHLLLFLVTKHYTNGIVWNLSAVTGKLDISCSEQTLLCVARVATGCCSVRQGHAGARYVKCINPFRCAFGGCRAAGTQESPAVGCPWLCNHKLHPMC